MPSIVITGNRYRAKPDEATRFGRLQPTYLAEGDSWMDASAWNQGSLPEYLARAFNKQHRAHLIVNISTSGHTLTRIVDMLNDDLGWWLEQQTFQGLLLSAGGNDFIDAARDPAPGQGLLHDLRGKTMPADPYACVRQDALQTLRDYLDQNFERLYQAVRQSAKNATTPIYLNAYDTPVARDAPAIRDLTDPWLFTAYTNNGIDPDLWPGLTQGIFRDIRQTIQGWAAGRTGVIVVPTTGLLTPADQNSKGDSGDWVNEIHPNARGWKKQAQAWLATLPG